MVRMRDQTFHVCVSDLSINLQIFIVGMGDVASGEVVHLTFLYVSLCNVA